MSQFRFSFAHRVAYSRYSDIVVPLAFSSDSKIFYPVDAKLDTGSTFCVFQRHFADLLELDLERGQRQWIGTATGSFLTYGHEVTLATCGLEWQAVVYFAESENFYLNVVGRIGFLDRLQIALVEYDQELYLSPYEG
ncbi:MAG: hypothetical protein SF097_26840 [Acidobacteriota bacterium]|nr:hypothetical protein [Acidobacteriota bacterium]